MTQELNFFEYKVNIEIANFTIPNSHIIIEYITSG